MGTRGYLETMRRILTPLMWEHVSPFVYSGAALFLWWWSGALFPKDFTQLMTATGTVAAVLTGFLSTAKAVVLGLTGSEVFQRLKAAGYHNDFLAYMRVGVLASIALLTISVLGLFIEPTQTRIRRLGLKPPFRILGLHCGIGTYDVYAGYKQPV